MPRLNVDISSESKKKYDIVRACLKKNFKKSSNLSSYLMEKIIDKEYKKILKKGV